MSKNTNLSQLDHNQMIAKEHDQENDAKRVIIVGGEKMDISIDSDKIAKAVKDGLSSIKFETLIPEKVDKTEPHFNVIEVEKQVFIPQVEYRTVEVPVIVKETVYKTIEVPVIVKETEYKEIVTNGTNEVPTWVKVAFASQSLLLVGLMILQFLRK